MLKKRISKIVFFIISLSIAISILGDVLIDEDMKRYYLYFKTKPNVDVLFMGTSAVVSGISPLDLWNEYGILSFNLAGYGQSIQNNYWMMRSAIKVHKPKVLVFELDYLNKEEFKKETFLARSHQMLDSLPFSIDKYKAIYDLIPLKDIRDFLFPNIMYYHNRWKSIFNKEDELVNEMRIVNMGGEVWNISMKDGEPFDKNLLKEPPVLVPINKTIPCPKENEKYLNKIIRLCNQNNIKPIFIVFPRYENAKIQGMYNYIGKKLDNKNIDFINCQRLINEMEFDYSEDMRDYSHLNISGNKKVTLFVGKLLYERYGIKGHKGESMTDILNKNFEKLKKIKETVISQKLFQ